MLAVYRNYVEPVLEKYFSTSEIADEFHDHITYEDIYLRRPIGPFWLGFYFHHIDVILDGKNPVTVVGYIPHYVPKKWFQSDLEPGYVGEEVIDIVDPTELPWVTNPDLKRLESILGKYPQEELSYELIVERAEEDEVPQYLEVDLTEYLNLQIKVTAK